MTVQDSPDSDSDVCDVKPRRRSLKVGFTPIKDEAVDTSEHVQGQLVRSTNQTLSSSNRSNKHHSRSSGSHNNYHNNNHHQNRMLLPPDLISDALYRNKHTQPASSHPSHHSQHHASLSNIPTKQEPVSSSNSGISSSSSKWHSEPRSAPRSARQDIKYAPLEVDTSISSSMHAKMSQISPSTHYSTMCHKSSASNIANLNTTHNNSLNAAMSHGTTSGSSATKLRPPNLNLSSGSAWQAVSQTGGATNMSRHSPLLTSHPSHIGQPLYLNTSSLSDIHRYVLNCGFTVT